MTTNFQLENEAEKLKHRNFRGVVMRDQLKDLKTLDKECEI